MRGFSNWLFDVFLTKYYGGKDIGWNGGVSDVSVGA
jgi:hypothetical protein